jgi:hypothetical protein
MGVGSVPEGEAWKTGDACGCHRSEIVVIAARTRSAPRRLFVFLLCISPDKVLL